MNKAFAYALALAGFAASAHAADVNLDTVKGAIPDGPITWAGVTFYGTVDVGYAYINNGSYPSGAFYHGAGYSVLGSPFNHGDVSTLTNNALQLSNVGLKIEEQIGGGFLAIGKLETQFNPISGELGDACASLLRFSGRSLYDQEKNGDGSRCGQAFANGAYAGLSNPVYGTLTVGRQSSLVNDGTGVYDPMANSPAFSLIGYSGTAGAGIGSTETAYWDESVKYIFTYGPLHAAGMYTNGGQDTPIVNDAYGANVGITYAGFSIDGFYTQVNGAVSLSGLPLAGAANGYGYFTGTTVQNACNAALGTCPGYLLGTVTNNEAWDVMAKYTFNVPSLFSETALSTKDAPSGGLKDGPVAPPPSAKLTFYGGYQYVDLSNPSEPQSFYSGFTTIGGYRYITNPNGNLAFGSDRIRETAWAGVSYVDGPWRLVGAYYYTNQNSWLTADKGAAGNGAALNSCIGQTYTNQHKAGFVGNPIGKNCSGDFNQGSFLVDYTFNRHLDIYAGVTFDDQTGGLNSGYLADNSWAFASGVRIKW